MAIFRNVQMSFWTDTKVVDEFTPEDKYFYLYLFTNPHTNLCGCYEISKTQMSTELGYTKESIEGLINRFCSVHKVSIYDRTTKEMLLLNWHKYNWTKSPDFHKALFREIESVKNAEFKRFLRELADGVETVLIPSYDGVGTTVTVSDSNTVYINNNILPKDNITCGKIDYQIIVDIYHYRCPSLPKVTKITDARKKLINARLKDYSEKELEKAFMLAEESDFLTGRSGKWTGANFDWIMNTNNIVKILEGNYRNKTEPKKNEFNNFQQSNYDWDEINKELGIK